jgi:hypothetical protein
MYGVGSLSGVRSTWGRSATVGFAALAAPRSPGNVGGVTDARRFHGRLQRRRYVGVRLTGNPA